MISLFPQNYFFLYHPPRLTVYRVLSFFGRSKIRERFDYEVPEVESLAQTVYKMKESINPGRDASFFLGLPLNYFNIVNFTLPRVAEESLDPAVHYELIRHVPYDLSTAFINYKKELTNSNIKITATMVLKDHILPLLTAFSSAGLNLSSVFPNLLAVASVEKTRGVYITRNSEALELIVWDGQRVVFSTWESGEMVSDIERFASEKKPLFENLNFSPDRIFLWQTEAELNSIAPIMGLEEGKNLSGFPLQFSSLDTFPYQINLISGAALKAKKARFWLRATAFTLLFLSVASYPLFVLGGRETRLRRLEESLTALQTQAQRLTEIREKNRELIKNLKGIAQFVQSEPRVLDILKEVTEIVPSDAWLQRFIFSSDTIQLQGTAASATVIVEALENSPLFKEAQFDSPVVKRGNLETFRIMAKLEK